MKSSLTCAFSLGELLVVLAIISIAMGLMASTMRQQNKDESVRAAAEALAGTLRETRARAMATREPYAVAFHIQNAPGSSGKVLNNRSGGHGYRILGPSRSLNQNGNTGSNGSKWGGKRSIFLPFIGDTNFNFENSPASKNLDTLPRYLAELEQLWASPFISLPGGRVRFLALSETDEGCRINADNQSGISNAPGGGLQTDRAWAYAPTYPRPWFGYFDQATGRLFPWGGYDHQLGIDQPWRPITGGATPITNYTGFFYAGKDGPIIGCTTSQAQERAYTENPGINGTVLPGGSPRALVNSDWADALIVFLPNGDAWYPPFGVARKRYFCGQYNAATTNRIQRQANGVSDMTRGWVWRHGMRTLPNPAGGLPWSVPWQSDWSFQPNGTGVTWGSPAFEITAGPQDQLSEQSEFGHFDAHLGGYHITLGPDSPDDKDTFASARDALSSIMPAYRVYVSRSGAVEVVRCSQREDAWLAQQGTPFPANKDFFIGRTGAGSVYGGNDAAYMGRNFRFGWLHEDKPRSGNATFTIWGGNGQSASFTEGPSSLIPRGKPLSYAVTPRMLTDKIWWTE